MVNWKRVAALLSALCVLLCLCACGSRTGDPGGTDPDPRDTPQVSPAQTKAPLSGEEAPSSAPGEVLSLQKQLYGLYDWEESDLLVRSECSYVTLSPEDAARYPALAEAMEQRAAMIRRSMEDEYDSFRTSVREEDLPWVYEGMEAWASTLDVQVRRADSVAVSLLSDSYTSRGFITDFRGMGGTTYDAQTGRELALGDVVEDMSAIPPLVTAALNCQTWLDTSFSQDAVADYFSRTPEDGLSWTLDYNGITFYFNDLGDLSADGPGACATIPFAGHEELFCDTYLAVPDGYMVELSMDSSFFTDLNGDGGLEELYVTGVYDGDVGMYTQFGLHNGDSGFYYEDCFADDLLPYYVKTAGGGHYLYLFCREDEGAEPPMFTLRVFDVRGVEVTDVGKMYAGPGLISAGIYRLPTDPGLFYLDDFDSTEPGMEPFAVGQWGMPEPS